MAPNISVSNWETSKVVITVCILDYFDTGFELMLFLTPCPSAEITVCQYTTISISYYLLICPIFLFWLICKATLILQIVIVPLKGLPKCDFKPYCGGDSFAFEVQTSFRLPQTHWACCALTCQFFKLQSGACCHLVAMMVTNWPYWLPPIICFL